MDFSQIATCINWLAPVSNSYDGVLRIMPDAICAVSTTASAVARQSVLPMSGKPYGVPDKIMQLIDWKRVSDAQLHETRLAVTYGNGDTVFIPLVELNDDVAIPAMEIASDKLKWLEFPYADKLKWLLDTTARDDYRFNAIHFIGPGMYASVGPVMVRAKRAVIDTDYGKFALPLYAAEYITKLRGAVEVALCGSVDWTNNNGKVIGQGPSMILVRSEGMTYSAQLQNMAPTPHDVLWSKINGEIKYRGVVAENMLHYMKLAVAMDSTKVSPTFTVMFSENKLAVSFADKDGEINGTVPVTWENNEWPDYQAYFAVGMWLDRGGDVEVGFCSASMQPMVIYYAPGMDIAVMPRSKKARG
jgi:hypothetical protein